MLDHMTAVSSAYAAVFKRQFIISNIISNKRMLFLYLCIVLIGIIQVNPSTAFPITRTDINPHLVTKLRLLFSQKHDIKTQNISNTIDRILNYFFHLLLSSNI